MNCTKCSKLATSSIFGFDCLLSTCLYCLIILLYLHPWFSILIIRNQRFFNLINLTFDWSYLYIIMTLFWNSTVYITKVVTQYLLSFLWLIFIALFFKFAGFTLGSSCISSYGTWYRNSSLNCSFSWLPAIIRDVKIIVNTGNKLLT